MALRRRQLFAQARQLVDHVVRLVRVTLDDVALLFVGGRVLREALHQHAELGVDLGETAARSFAGGRRLAVFVVRDAFVGFALQPSRWPSLRGARWPR